MRSLDITKLQRYSLHRLIIVFSLLFFLFISINSISAYISNTYKNHYASRIEINLISSSVNEKDLITAGDIEDLAMAFPNGSISYMNQSDSIIEANNAIFPIKTVSSGENLERFLGLDILRGCFFNSEQYQYGNKVAVISDTLAYKLFTTHNIIGNEIYISGVKYRIIGLYKSKSSLLSVLSSDGSERVYIPFNSMTNISSEALNTVFIKDDSLKDKPFRVHTIEETLKECLRMEPNLYRINDFNDSSIYTAQPLFLFVFLVGVLLICLIIKYLIKYLTFGYFNLKSGLKNNYFIQLMIKWKLRIPLFIIGAALILLIIGITFSTIKFKGTIPAEYIPVDNIFDFGFYADKLKDAIYKLNSNVGYVPTQMEILFNYNLLVIYISTLLLLINFIAAMSAIKLNKFFSDSIADQMKAFAVLAASILIGLALAFVICLACGIKYTIPVKEMIILTVFFAIKLINEDRIDSLKVRVL